MVFSLYQRLDKKDYKKRSRRAFRSAEVTIPNPDMYISSEPSSALSHTPSTPPPPPPMVGFPSPTSPMMAPVRLQMHGRNGVHGDSSDEGGDDDDDDDDDEFEDS